MRRYHLQTWMILLCVALARSSADAICNSIPTTERTFASKLGAIDRPYASPGRQVRLTVDCENGPFFVPGNTTVQIHFEPPDPGPSTTVVLDPGSPNIVHVEEKLLDFTFPDTEALLGGLRTGPARIVATVGGVDGPKIADIDRLGTRVTECGADVREYETFPSFTALPPANQFHCVAVDGACPDADEVVRATIDDDGNLLVPWDWSDVFPSGPGFDVVARLVQAGQNGLEAFPGTGEGIRIRNASYVSSHTLTGSFLPPFLDVGPPIGSGPFPGSALVGTVDGRDGVLRVARTIGNDPDAAIFDLRSRLENGVGAIIVSHPQAIEDRLVDLRSFVAEGHVTAFQERNTGNGSVGLVLYDNVSGSFARIAGANSGGPIPRRVALSSDLLAFYEAERDRTEPDLTVYPLAELQEGSDGFIDVAERDLIRIDLFGSKGALALPPAVGNGVAGGYTGVLRFPIVYAATGALSYGRPVGGANLIEREDRIENLAEPLRQAYFGGALATLGPDAPGHVFAAGDRAVFLVCDGGCVGDDGEPDDVTLKLLDLDGTIRSLARNPGVPFAFTGSLIGLAVYEDGSYGAGRSGATDIDGDGRFDGVYLAVYDLESDRLLPLEGPQGPVALPAAGLEIAASEHVLTLRLDEQEAGPLTCDHDQGDQVLAFFNGRTRTLVNTREPMTVGGLVQSRALLTMLQPEDTFGQSRGAIFLKVMRDSDADEIVDPYDNCPLYPNLDQADANRDGVGDVCDPACASGVCPHGRGVSKVFRKCQEVAAKTTTALAKAMLKRARRCPDQRGCAATAGAEAAARTKGRAAASKCGPGALAAIETCAADLDALVGLGPGAGCLVAAVETLAESMANAQDPAAGSGGIDVACQTGVRRVMADYVTQREKVLQACHKRWLIKGDPALACDRVPKVGQKLAKLGVQARKGIERACASTSLAQLGLCGGAETLDALASADGTGGCLITSHARALDRLLAVQLGASAPGPRATAVPCPATPQPEPTGTPKPHSISVRLRLDAPDGRSSDFDIGWSGIAHDQKMFGGAGFDATLACGASGPCSFEADLAGRSFAAPMPLSAFGAVVCFSLEFADHVVGTFDPDTGALAATIPLRSTASVGGATFGEPCPACVPLDGVPELGELGQCSRGPRSGAICRIGGLANPIFGALAGTSADCPSPADAVPLVSSFTIRATTGTSALTTSPDTPHCGAPPGRQCPCSICNDPLGTACNTNADCPTVAGNPGVCNPRYCAGGTNDHALCTTKSECPGGNCTPRVVPQLDSCPDDTVTPGGGPGCEDQGDGNGVCSNGPQDSFCSDEQWRPCTHSADCAAGTCQYQNRSCFLDPIVRTGTTDVPVDGQASPTLAAAFCMPFSRATLLDNAGGLPGPGALVVPAEVVFRR